MRTRSLAWAVVACVAAACGHLAGHDDDSSYGAYTTRSKLPPRPRAEAGTQPLPTIMVSRELQPAGNLKLHSGAACDTRQCTLEVLVRQDCSMDLSPQWLALDRAIDAFALTFVVSGSSARGATLTALHEKGSKPSNPKDLFYRQTVQNGGKEILVENVANHFGAAKHYDIEASVDGKACPPLDPPILPDY